MRGAQNKRFNFTKISCQISVGNIAFSGAI